MATAIRVLHVDDETEVTELTERFLTREDDRFEVVEFDRALGRMDRLITRTLTLARSGRVVGETEPVDLPELTEECWRNVATDASTLRVENVPEIQADRDRLRHLFENLYRNAVEHGGHDVTVTVGSLADGFYVEDDGPGIPAEDLEVVFDTGYSTTEEGTGLGLSIVEQIVEAHDWDVRATNGAEGGVRFEFTGLAPAVG